MKKRKFAEGGVTEDDLEVANASEDPIGTLNKRKGWTETEEVSETVTPKKQSFKEAFAEARKGGGKTFEWEGKKYTTELASDKKAAPKTEVAKPAAKPTAKYETPYDRMNRKNREMSQAQAETRAETERLAKKNPGADRWKFDASKVDSKTLLPKMASGGKVRGWGMARGARKAKIV